jgi:hypothetical protein
VETVNNAAQGIAVRGHGRVDHVSEPDQPTRTRLNLESVTNCFNMWSQLMGVNKMMDNEFEAFVNAGMNHDWPPEYCPRIE